jgi:hypothetical protein
MTILVGAIGAGIMGADQTPGRTTSISGVTAGVVVDYP